jgi:methyl-accepting chemotaxis protein
MFSHRFLPSIAYIFWCDALWSESGMQSFYKKILEMRLFERLTIRERILLIGIVIVISFATVALFMQSADIRIQSADLLSQKYQTASRLSRDLSFRMGKAEDTIKRYVVAPDNDTKASLETSFDTAITDITLIRDLSVSLGNVTFGTMKQRIEGIDMLFDELDTALQRQGTRDEAGLRQAFVSAGIDLDTFLESELTYSGVSSLSRLQALVFKMRRLERDLIYAGNKPNEVDLYEAIQDLKRAINMLVIDDDSQAIALEKVNAYEAMFGAFRGAQVRLQRLLVTIEKAFADIEPDIRQLVEIADTKAAEQRALLLEAQSRARDMVFMSLLVAGVSILILALAISFSIIEPLRKTKQALERMSAGELQIKMPYMSGRNELSDLARAIEVLRRQSARVAELEEEKAIAFKERSRERRAMMAELNKRFGSVVDAALQGDFSTRVETDFDVQSMNDLAISMNKLMETFEHGLSSFGDVLNALANRNLSQRMEGHFQGAFADLQQHTNSMADSLSLLVHDIANAAGTLRDATDEIMSGANDLSQRSTEQAATLKETLDLSDDLTKTVSDTARKAQAADKSATDARQLANQTADVMNDMMQGMERIETSTRKIGDIVGLIEQIAFQTNLLALNASVEAARAGEHGRGFAVVADEVRRLAQSASKASEEVQSLIRKSDDDVKQGVGYADNASQSLQKLFSQIESASTIMRDIARANLLQSQRLGDLNSSIRDLDITTQKNAALVEETNAAVQSSLAQAERLEDLVMEFELLEDKSIALASSYAA